VTAHALDHEGSTEVLRTIDGAFAKTDPVADDKTISS